MTVIKQEDFIQSICDAFQFISYYHPKDYIDALYKAWQKEENPAAKDAMTQILVNSRMCAENNRPICQDTGIATVFLKVGMNVQWDADMSVEEMVNEGVRRAYTWEGNTLRASVLADPAGKRQNTKDNTPAVIHMSIVPGDKVEVTCAAKGGGSENKSKLAMLNPSDNIVDWVLKTIPTMGAGWCPPGILGIGIGGTPEKAVLMAKESLMSHIDIQELQDKAKSGAELNTVEKLRLELYEKVNALGIGGACGNLARHPAVGRIHDVSRRRAMCRIKETRWTHLGDRLTVSASLHAGDGVPPLLEGFSYERDRAGALVLGHQCLGAVIAIKGHIPVLATVSRYILANHFHVEVS